MKGLMILDKLQSSKNSEAEQALLYLHQQVYKMARRFIMERKGSLQDAEDIFQESLVILYKMAKQKKFRPDINLEAYLYTICRNRWLKELKSKKEDPGLPDNLESVAVEEVVLKKILTEERRQTIDTILKGLGHDCYRILLSFYYDRLKMEEIAELMNYANAQVAKNKKSRCLKKLREMVLESPQFKEGFF